MIILKKDANTHKKISILCHDPPPAWMSLSLTLFEQITLSSLPAGHVNSVCLTEQTSLHDIN